MGARLLDLRALSNRDLAAWHDLVVRAVEPNPFFEPDFVLAAHRHLEPRNVGLLVAQTNGDWSGCLPVVSGRWRGPIRAVRTWRHMYAYLGTPLLAGEDLVTPLRELLRAASAARSGGLVAFEWMSADGPVAAALNQALEGSGLTLSGEMPFDRAALRRLDEGLLLERLPKRRRYELKRQRRRLEELLDGSLRCVDRAGDPAATERFLELESSGWKGQKGTALASRPSHAAFFREICEAFSAGDRLQLLELEAGGRTVAMKCNLLADPWLFTFKIAYDEELGRFSPGVQMEIENVDNFNRTGPDWMDSCANPDNELVNRLWPTAPADHHGRARPPRSQRQRLPPWPSRGEGGARAGRTKDIGRYLKLDRRQFEECFGREPLVAPHELLDHPLLTLDALGDLADFLPEDRVERLTGDAPDIVTGGGSELSELSPGEVARTIEDNGLWMVLKNIEQHPEYKRLLDQTLDEVAPLVQDHEGGMTFREGFVFLSSPGSTTPSHTDPEHNFLMQVHGTKQMTVGRFPDERTRQLEIEDHVSGGHRNIEWLPVEPRVFDMSPGEAVYVPPHAPHMVKNGPTASISFSITFRTPQLERIQRVSSINARMRRLGLSPKPPGRRAAADRVKFGTSKALGRVRRLG